MSITNPTPAADDPHTALQQQISEILAGDALGEATDVANPRQSKVGARALDNGQELGRSTPHAGRGSAAESESQSPQPMPREKRSAPIGKFLPLAPRSLKESGIGESEIEAILMRFLLHRGSAAGAVIAEQIALPFAILEDLLHRLKADRMVAHKGAASLGDFVYELTDLGVQRARRCSQQCSYYGSAPVCLEDYVTSVQAQSLEPLKPKLDDLRRAFADLMLGKEIVGQLGRAMNSGRGLFLYGSPGNGKTSIAERVTKAYGSSIWIPKAISAWGEIIRLYDPSNHEALPLVSSESFTDEEKIDSRWIRIRRPTIIAGGELTLDHLEITSHPDTGISEAPLQLKSNCGTLVIDDFGRQRVSPVELLNRWIVPLEKRYDFLNLASGRKIQVPFDQFIVFSTNLEPKDLVDEAFLRRIPYKIDVADPTEQQFRDLFLATAKKRGLACEEDTVDYLMERHYRQARRLMRFCHPRDLVEQVDNYRQLNETPPTVTRQAIDAAVKDYFAVMQ